VDCVGCSAMLANELEEKKRKGWMQGAPVVGGVVKSWTARKRRQRGLVVPRNKNGIFNSTCITLLQHPYYIYYY